MLSGSGLFAGVGSANNAGNVGNANNVYGVAGSNTFKTWCKITDTGVTSLLATAKHYKRKLLVSRVTENWQRKQV